MSELRVPLTDESGEARSLTERDFAFARRRDGSLVNPPAYAHFRLKELEAELKAVRTADTARVDAILKGMREVEEALAPVAAE